MVVFVLHEGDEYEVNDTVICVNLEVAQSKAAARMLEWDEGNKINKAKRFTWRDSKSDKQYANDPALKNRWVGRSKGEKNGCVISITEEKVETE